jgi:succinoglycan biosynthesis transport protein ExoP
MTQDKQPLEQEGQDSARVRRGLLEIAWQRKPLIALGAAIALVLATFYYARAPRVYGSTAQVLVVKKRPDAVTGLDTRHLAIEDYVATHQTLIRSPLVVERAIKKRDLQALKCFAGQQDDLTDVIIASLGVNRSKTSSGSNNVLTLSFQATEPEDCATVLNAVIASYKDFLDETYRNTSEDAVQLITEARNVLEKKRADQEKAYAKFREEAPLVLRGKDGAELERLTSIESKLSALLLRKAELEGYLKTVESGLKQKGGREPLLAMLADRSSKAESEGTRGKLTLQDQLFHLLVEEQQLLETKAEKHPDVVAVRKRIELTRAFLSNPTAAREGIETADGKKGVPVDALEAYRDYFTEELKHAGTAEEVLSGLLKQEETSARDLRRYLIEDENFRTGIKLSTQLFDEIVKRLSEVNLVKSMGGYDASTIAPPRVGTKVQPRAMMVFSMALFLGILGGLGLVYLAEVTDKSFHSVEEVRRRLGLPVVGQIPFVQAAEPALRAATPNGHLLDPMLCTYYQPKSGQAESYRGVRTALYFGTHGEGHQVIQVTSPHSGDGKTTLATNLAVSIAQSGKKVLLIDADLRKPQIHRIFGLSGQVGLGSIIAEGTEPKEVIQTSAIPGLSILPCGPIPSNPAELLTSPRFKEVLDYLRDQYDFVIVDTPPLLVVTDPSVVAPRVDGVILNIRLTKNGRPPAQRSREILNSLGANVLGVVVNDVEQRAGGSGYQEGYGYYTDSYADENGEGDEAAAAREAADKV